MVAESLAVLSGRKGLVGAHRARRSWSLRRPGGLLAALALVVAACAAQPAADLEGIAAVRSPAPTVLPRVVLPPPAARMDYQLGGAYRPPAGTRVVERDRSEAPAVGTYGICYLNGYQTQPEENRWWLARHPDLLLRDRSGRTVEDPGWPGELLFDTSTAARRAALAQVEYAWIDGCARAGHRAVEADNLDSWTRSRGLLRQDGNLALARLLNRRAHLRGLASAQKNTPELAAQGRRLGFDLAVAEECGVYDECTAYTRAYGALVLEVEYTDNGRTAFARSCASAAGRRSIVLRDRLLTTPGRSGYAYRAC